MRLWHDNVLIQCGHMKPIVLHTSFIHDPIHHGTRRRRNHNNMPVPVGLGDSLVSSVGVVKRGISSFPVCTYMRGVEPIVLRLAELCKHMQVCTTVPTFILNAILLESSILFLLLLP